MDMERGRPSRATTNEETAGTEAETKKTNQEGHTEARPEPAKPNLHVVLKKDASLPPPLAATNTSDLLRPAELVIRRRLKRQQQRRRRNWRRFNWTAEEPFNKAEQWIVNPVELSEQAPPKYEREVVSLNLGVEEEHV
jgi:hypothetical protein